MATVKGVWEFKNVLTSVDPVKYWYATFVSYDSYYTCIAIDPEIGEGVCYKFCDTADPTYFHWESAYSDSDGWAMEEYKLIDFGETEQEVSDEFYNWLVENAGPPIPRIEINISQNGTLTLATAGKYCDKNIQITVDV